MRDLLRVCRVEDNLFILQYCTEESYRMKIPTFVTSIDYSEDFASIKREQLVEAMMEYRMVTRLYEREVIGQIQPHSRPPNFRKRIT